MLKIGVLGAGHLGKIHLQVLAASSAYSLIGFYDPNPEVQTELFKSHGYKAFESPEKLIAVCDVIDIVTPTLFHFDMAMLALNAKKHVFIEKPIATSDKEAEAIVSLANKNEVIGMVGHVERFNPAYKAVYASITEPRFIETHRLAEFNPRGTDVSVVLDLMIHDIDIILSVVKSPIKNIKASGVAVISETPDISNARIEFENGCVANLTASRISLKKMRKSRFFQKNAYISVDFLDKKVEVVKIKNAPKESDDFSLLFSNADGKRKQIYFENPKIIERNAIQDELEHFAEAIKMKKKPNISLKNGAKALEIAHKIISCIG